ncbi:MAG: hypothetical protein QNJ06_03320 [Kiloniellales bacterium]|nr:hypothetical protein [Kiloniellales bacterium]MDJ0980714.1 hypothetical protein [Kiloniellales bacterium]
MAHAPSPGRAMNGCRSVWQELWGMRGEAEDIISLQPLDTSEAVLACADGIA